jgi:hypothetical protein
MLGTLFYSPTTVNVPLPWGHPLPEWPTVELVSKSESSTKDGVVQC